LSAATELDGWSALNMAEVTDLPRAFWKECELNPEAVMAADYDAFAKIDHPALVRFRASLNELTKMSCDDSTTVHMMRDVRAELYSPKDVTNAKSTMYTLQFLRMWGEGAGKTMDNGQAVRYMKGGIYGVDKQTPEMRKAFKNTLRNTNNVESYFGDLKYYDKLCTNIASENANGVVAAKRDGLFDNVGGQFVVRRKARLLEGCMPKRTIKRKRLRDAPRVGRIVELGP
jgi:hypothetical protein